MKRFLTCFLKRDRIHKYIYVKILTKINIYVIYTHIENYYIHTLRFTKFRLITEQSNDNDANTETTILPM